MLTDSLLQCPYQVVHLTPMVCIQDMAKLMEEERLEQKALAVQTGKKIDRQVKGPHRRCPVAESWRQLLGLRVLAMYPSHDPQREPGSVGGPQRWIGNTRTL